MRTQELGKIALKKDPMRRGTKYRTVEFERKLVSNLIMACDSSTLSWDLHSATLESEGMLMAVEKGNDRPHCPKHRLSSIRRLVSAICHFAVALTMEFYIDESIFC